jgi:hypothetical protein
VLLFSSSAFPQTQPVHATIDASKTSHPISKYIYGQFLEHAGNLLNEGVWAEMLADRKFYYPISSQPPEEPPTPPWRRRGPLRHWTPMVADEFITMDSENPYTGDHSPLVKLDKTELHGFMQSGLNPTINGTKVASQGHLWRMAPDKLTAVNIVGQKPEVEVQEQELTPVPDTMSLPPFSISIYSFPVQ